MNIEGGAGIGIGGVAGGIGPAVGGITGNALDIGPAIGSVALPGNEGPVRSLEGFVPMGRNDINTLDLIGGTHQPDFSLAGEIVFQAQPPLNEVDILAEAQSILTPGKVTAEPEIVQGAAYWFVDIPKSEQVVRPAEVIMPLPQVEPLRAAAPAIELVISAKRQAETGNSTQTTPAKVPQPLLQEQEQKEEVEEAVENKEPRKGEEVLQEEDAERRLYLEDQEVSAVRRHEIRDAVTKARIEADRLGLKRIAGWLVAKFLPPEHQGNRSQVVKKTGPDGSYQETVEEIAGAGEFESDQQAVKKSDQIVAGKKPVKLGKEGVAVAGEHVARVFKYRIIKPARVYTEVVKRVVKKRVVPQVVETPQAVATPGWTTVTGTSVKSEPALADFPALEGVFPKAA